MCLKRGNKHIVKIIAKSVNVLMFLIFPEAKNKEKLQEFHLNQVFLN